jgi:hypothetical protein
MTMPTQKHTHCFELIEFNHVRYGRGKDAAKIRVIVDGEDQGFLWMSAEDLRLNISEFGASEALEKALRSYGETV